jgi:chemotaxis protein CheD
VIRTENFRHNLPLYIVYPGEHFFTPERCFINTVSGSCLVVCLHDPVMRIGGIGHFIIPGTLGTEGIYASEIAEHGVYSIELLVADFVKAGGDRRRLQAKLFGAGFSIAGSVSASVTESNISFIREYLHAESIAVTGEDLGGNTRRYILFRPDTGDAYRKVLKNNHENSEFIRLEQEYIATAFRNREIKTNFVLFE